MAENKDVYENLRSLLNTDTITPDELKTGIKAAIDAIIKNPNLTDYEYNIIRDAVSKHTNLLEEIATEMDISKRKAFQEALTNHTIKPASIDMKAYDTAFAAISRIAQQKTLSENDLDVLQSAIGILGTQNIDTPELLENLKTINEKFPKEFDEACREQFAEDELPSAEFSALYKDVTGKDFFVSATPTQQDADELDAILRNVAETIQKQEDERSRRAIEERKERERQEKLRAAEEAKAFKEQEFLKAWNAASGLDYIKQTLDGANLPNDMMQQISDFLETTFPNPNSTDKIYQTLETALNNDTKMKQALKETLLRLAQNADSITAEKETSRWAHVSRLAADETTVVLSGITPDEITAFSAHDYIADNIKNNEIFNAFTTKEQREELLKINEKITDNKNRRLQFETAMARSSVEFTPATISAVLDFVGRAEDLDNHRVEMEKQEQLDAERATKREKLETLLIDKTKTATSAQQYLESVIQDKDFIALAEISPEQQSRMVTALQEAVKNRENNPTTEHFSKDFIQQLNDKNVFGNDTQKLNLMIAATMLADNVDDRVATQQQSQQNSGIDGNDDTGVSSGSAGGSGGIDDTSVPGGFGGGSGGIDDDPDPDLETEYENLCDDLFYSARLSEYVASIEPMLDAESLKSAMALKVPHALNAQYDPCAKALDNPDWLIALQETYENNWMSLSDEPLLEDRKNRWQKFSENAKNFVSATKEEIPLSPEAEAEKERIGDDVKGIIQARLKMLIADPSGITVENAYAWLQLAQGSGLETEVYNKVGQVLYEYDKEHFGDKTPEELQTNYEQATKDLQDYLSNKGNSEFIMEPYTFIAEDDGEKEKALTWWRDCFTTEEGGVINSINAQAKIKESILSIAAELVAQDYAKQPPVDKDGNPLSGKAKEDRMFRDLTDKINMITLSQKRLTKDEAIINMSVHISAAETFKNRIKTKFEGCALYTNINNRLNKLDKVLTNRYGKKYIMAKKISKYAAKAGKFTAKTGWNVTKGMAKFLAANAIAPGIGPAVLIAYNTAKQWKSVKEQLSDPSISKSQKIAILAGTGLVSALSATAAATGLAPALESLGLNTPESIQYIGNMMSTVGGRAGRIAAITLGNSLPNIAKMYGISRKIKALQERIQIQSEEVKKNPSSETELKQLQKLIKESQELKKLKQLNTQELIEKAASAALGGGLGTLFGPTFQKLMSGGATIGVATTAVAATELASENNDTLQSEPAVKAEPVDSLKTATVDSTNVAQQFSATQEELNDSTTQQDLAAKVAAAQRAEEGDTTQTSTSTQSTTEEESKSADEPKPENKAEAKSADEPKPENKAEAKSTDEPKPENKAEAKSADEAKSENKAEAKPTAASQNDQADTQTIEQQHAKNFEAAKVEGTSGHGNLSAHQDTIRHLTNLGDNRFEDVNATAQQLSEHLGDKTNMAVIACRMNPTDVYNALGLNGTDTPLTTHEMINYLANHDLTAEQQTNLNHVLEEKFGNWYSNTETHGATPDSHSVSDNNSQQGDAGSKPAADSAKTNTSTAEKLADAAKATAASAAAAAADKAAATTGDQAATTEFHKMHVDPTGNKFADNLNDKYAVTNGLEGEQKESISFKPLSSEEAAKLGLQREQAINASQQHASQEEHSSSKHATVEHRTTTSHHTTHTTHNDIPVEAAVPLVYGSVEWAVQNGYVYDPQLSMGLNHGGTLNENGTMNNSGYAGAYRHLYSNKVMFIPNNPIEDADLVQEQYANVAKDMQKMHDGPYARSNTPFGLLNTILHGTGHINNATTTEAKVMARVAMGGAILDSVRGMFGHHPRG